MSVSKLTDERLRHWVQDQASRERLCLAVLALEDGYRNPKPRRPSGGPDGGRDIEAYRGQEIVWAAVGFRNHANDSAADRRWATKKFKGDLASARKENSVLKAFAFFTNVDLPPAQIRLLEQHARSEGFEFVDIFFRERIRIHLDSPRGLAIRYQYLDVPLSEAEQKAFFGQWGSELERLLHSRLGVIEEQVERLEFLHSCHWPLKSIRLEIDLGREYSIEELGHFRALAVVFDAHEPTNARHLYIGVRDSYGSTLYDGKQGYSAQTLAWFRDPSQLFQESSVSMSKPATRVVCADTYLYKRGPLERLQDLDQRDVVIYMSERLAAKAVSVRLVANDYEVLYADMRTAIRNPVITEEPEALRKFREEHRLSTMPGDERRYAPVPWPKVLSQSEAADKWFAVGPSTHDVRLNARGYVFQGGLAPEPPWWWIWTIDFRNKTPLHIPTDSGVTREPHNRVS